jgi:hypothetical protein
LSRDRAILNIHEINPKWLMRVRVAWRNPSNTAGREVPNREQQGSVLSSRWQNARRELAQIEIKDGLAGKNGAVALSHREMVDASELTQKAAIWISESAGLLSIFFRKIGAPRGNEAVTRIEWNIVVQVRRL